MVSFHFNFVERAGWGFKPWHEQNTFFMCRGLRGGELQHHQLKRHSDVLLVEIIILRTRSVHLYVTHFKVLTNSYFLTLFYCHSPGMQGQETSVEKSSEVRARDNRGQDKGREFCLPHNQHKKYPFLIIVIYHIVLQPALQRYLYFKL